MRYIATLKSICRLYSESYNSCFGYDLQINIFSPPKNLELMIYSARYDLMADFNTSYQHVVTSILLNQKYVCFGYALGMICLWAIESVAVEMVAFESVAI